MPDEEKAIKITPSPRASGHGVPLKRGKEENFIKTNSVYRANINNSPYDVVEMIGNTWEWTRTRYFDKKDQKLALEE